MDIMDLDFLGGQVDLVEEDEDSMEGKYLTFRIGSEQYGLPIFNVTEIVGLQEITDVPELPDYVVGAINLRGRVIPAVDIRKRFLLDSKDYDQRTCIIVVDLDGWTVGLIVDRVAEVIEIPDDCVEPPPAIYKRATNRFISGMAKINDSVKILLNMEALLHDNALMKSKDLGKE